LFDEQWDAFFEHIVRAKGMLCNRAERRLARLVG